MNRKIPVFPKKGQSVFEYMQQGFEIHICFSHTIAYDLAIREEAAGRKVIITKRRPVDWPFSGINWAYTVWYR